MIFALAAFLIAVIKYLEKDNLTEEGSNLTWGSGDTVRHGGKGLVVRGSLLTYWKEAGVGCTQPARFSPSLFSSGNEGESSRLS